MAINRVNLKSALTQPRSAQEKSKYTFETFKFSNGDVRHDVTVKVGVPSLTDKYATDSVELAVHRYESGSTFIDLFVILHSQGDTRCVLLSPETMYEGWETFKKMVHLIGGVL